MRFGIMEMQLESLVPRDLPRQGILDYIRGFDHPAHVEELARRGFSLVELNGDLPIFFPGAYQPGAVDGLARLKSELEIAYTLHLPLWSVELSTPQTPVREASVQAVTQVIQETLPLEPECYVLHATGSLAGEFYRMHLPDMARGVILKQFQANALASVQAILASTGLSPRRLAIETIEFPFDLTLEIAETLDCSMCLDTGHVLVGFSGPIGMFEALDRCLPRLAEIHLHDGPWQGPEGTIGYGKDHQPLGSGDLDLPRFFDRLETAGFHGPVVFELTIDQAMTSLEQIQSIRPGLASQASIPGGSSEMP